MWQFNGEVWGTPPLPPFKNILILACCLMLNACGTPTIKVQEQVLMPPKALNGVISSIKIADFAGTHGAKFARNIRNILQSEKYIKVLETGARGILGGMLYANIDVSSDTTTAVDELQQEKDGKKYTVTITRTTEHINKTGTASVNYVLTYDGKTLAGDQYSTSTSSSTPTSCSTNIGCNSNEGLCDSAEANARLNNLWCEGTSTLAPPGNVGMISEMLRALSLDIVADIAPHKETVTFELTFGRDDSRLETGINYYKEQHYSEAEEYWNAVVNTSCDKGNKASAYYNLGVLRLHENKPENAFRMFTEADRLQPDNLEYVKALLQATRASLVDEMLKSSRGVTPVAKPATNNSCHLPTGGSGGTPHILGLPLY